MTPAGVRGGAGVASGRGGPAAGRTSLTTAQTQLVCLLGNPVAHSMSPQLHTAAFASCGIDAVYVACAVTDVRAAVTGLGVLGALGANITVPYKRTVWELVERRTEEAQRIGATNTLFREGGQWVADNTDALGLQRVLHADVGLQAGEAVVLFGAGGAARAAAVALGRLGARGRGEARRVEQAAEVQQLALDAGADTLDVHARPSVFINATPLGLHGEVLPERFHALAPDQLALDLVYGRKPTPFVRAARAAGATAWDGLGMLVAQAGVSFERWTGVEAPLAAMWDAARSHLGDR
ncbi:MAG TPA: shikimate dehydrogenase [Euzebyales bacterium]|nr:shikimate dehydrogenase [Euzebyales bacterium]